MKSVRPARLRITSAVMATVFFHITLFLSLHGDDLVGLEIEGVRVLLTRLKGFFDRDFAHGKVRVAVVILGYCSTCPPPAIRPHLHKLIAQVEDEEFALFER